MSTFTLTKEIVDQIEKYRHEVRSLGTKGGCYQVSLFIEHHFEFPMKEGIYQSSELEPVVSHRWNLLPNGSILESTADQFCEGSDIDIIEKDHILFNRYRPQWSNSLNPSATPWLSEIKWLGITDQEWIKRNPDKKISKGWWLLDSAPFLKWRSEMSEKYQAYR